MSQVEYRRRLKQQREAAENRANLSTFRKQTAVRHELVDAEPAQVQPSPQPTVQQPPVADTQHAVRIEPVSMMQPMPTTAAAIVPTAVNTLGMTPAKLREHARQTAEVIAQLPQEEYQASLVAMENNNPMLYSVVVDELNNMALFGGDEGDGFDLSGITPAQDRAGQHSDQPGHDAVGELQE